MKIIPKIRNTQASDTWENKISEEEIKKNEETPWDIKAIIKFDSDEGTA